MHKNGNGIDTRVIDSVFPGSSGTAIVKFHREMLPATTVRQVSAEGVRIGERLYDGTIAVTLDSVVERWTRKPLDELVIGDFDDLLGQQPEVVLLGTGAGNRFAPRELMFGFARLGVGFETMDTKAAARTFNVLAAEDRQVCAVLFPAANTGSG